MNGAPRVANQGPITVIQSQATNIQLNAVEPDGDSLEFVIVDNSTNGTLTLVNADNGSVSYQSNADYTGEDQFTFKVLDNNSFESKLATVTLEVITDEPTPDYGVASVNAVVNDGTSVTLNWTLSADNGTDPQGFVVLCGTDKLPSLTDLAELVEDNECSDGSGVVYLRDGAAKNFTWQGLVPRTNYQFAVVPFTNKTAYIRYNQGQQATTSAEPNTAPEAQAFKSLVTTSTEKLIDLDEFASDYDGDNLTFIIDNSSTAGTALLLDNKTGKVSTPP